MLNPSFGALSLVVISGLSFLAAKALLYQAGERRLGPVLSLATAALMTIPALFSRYLHSLSLSTALFAVLSIVILPILWNRGPGLRVPLPERHRHPWWNYLPALLIGFLVAWAAWFGYWWDEHSGHFGLTAVLSRGLVPPEHPMYPGEPFRYHYGFDVLAAQIRCFTGVSIARGIDLVTIWSFFLLLLNSYQLAGQIGGKKAAYWALLIVPLGSSTLQFLLFSDLGSMQIGEGIIGKQWAQNMPPPVISNFFQHPQGLGMSLSLGIIMVFTGTQGDYFRRRQMALGSLLLGMSSLAHIVFFGVMGLSLGVAVLVRNLLKKNYLKLIEEGFWLISALGIAFLLGGFLEPGTEVERVISFGSGYFQNYDLQATILRHGLYFGLPLLLLPLTALWALKKRQEAAWIVIAAATIGFVVPNLVNYGRSWDIVKFFGVGGVFANLLLAIWMGKTLRFNATKIVIALLCCFTSSFFLVRMSVADGRFGVPAMHFPGPSELGERMGARLAEHYHRPDAKVLHYDWYMTVSGGLLAPGHHWRVMGASFLIDRKRIEAYGRYLTSARRHLRPKDLRGLGVEYALLWQGDIDKLSPEGKANFKKYFRPLFSEGSGQNSLHAFRIYLDQPAP